MIVALIGEVVGLMRVGSRVNESDCSRFNTSGSWVNESGSRVNEGGSRDNDEW